jgi:hypothetical protein
MSGIEKSYSKAYAAKETKIGYSASKSFSIVFSTF